MFGSNCGSEGGPRVPRPDDPSSKPCSVTRLERFYKEDAKKPVKTNALLFLVKGAYSCCRG